MHNTNCNNIQIVKYKSYIITSSIIITRPAVKMMKEYVREYLEGIGERKYHDFSAKLIPGAENILGIRLPVLRAYAKELVKTEGLSALDGEDCYFEETMLRGMMIGYVRVTPEERLELIRDFVPRINNWSVCDSFCCTLRFPKKSRQQLWEFLQDYISSEKEFEQRFASVMLMNFFIDEDNIDRTLEALSAVNTDAYYSSMGTAWAAAECYLKFPEKTMPYLIKGVFDKDTHNRTISKICDSLRVPGETKSELKKLKR